MFFQPNSIHTQTEKKNINKYIGSYRRAFLLIEHTGTMWHERATSNLDRKGIFPGFFTPHHSTGSYWYQFIGKWGILQRFSDFLRASKCRFISRIFSPLLLYYNRHRILVRGCIHFQSMFSCHLSFIFLFQD